MVTAPTVEDLSDLNFAYGDKQAMINKQNAFNQYHHNFSVQLAAMVDELNIEFQFVAETRIDITNKSGQVATALQQVNTAKQSVDQSKIHIDQQKEAIDTTAGHVSDHAQEVADNRQLVADDKQAAADSAQAAGESAGQAEQSKQAAQDLYQDLNAVNTAKTQSQQAAQTATQQAGLAESSAATATEQAGIATDAAQQANVDIDQKLSDYVPRTGADLGSADLKARLTHNNGYFYIGPYNSSYGEGQLQTWWNDNAKQLNMGGAELRQVSVRNADVTGRKPVTNMDLVGLGASDTAAAVFALQAGGRSPTIRDDVNQGRASGMYYGIGAANLPDGNGHFFWSGYSSDSYNKFLFIQQNVTNRAWIGGNHNGAWSPPAEIWTNENLDVEVTSDGLKINNGANGGVTIGNRNGAYTHYTSDNGKHFFYGDLHSQSGFYGDGSGLTNLDAGNIATGLINFNRVPSTTSRTSTSNSHALTASAMNAHRTSSDHDGRYHTKAEVESLIGNATGSQFGAVNTYAVLANVAGSTTYQDGLKAGSSLSPCDSAGRTSDTQSTERMDGTWKLMTRAAIASSGTGVDRVGLWLRIS